MNNFANPNVFKMETMVSFICSSNYRSLPILIDYRVIIIEQWFPSFTKAVHTKLLKTNLVHTNENVIMCTASG